MTAEDSRADRPEGAIGAGGAGGTAGPDGSRRGHGRTSPGRTGEVARWEPGSRILWRYRENVRRTEHPAEPDASRGGGRLTGGQIHICRPVTVVQDRADLLAVWLAPGTECVKPRLADGTAVHAEPLETRYTKPRTVARDRWFGTGVLKLARPGEPWSVWLFWEQGWRFKNWYVNLEDPLVRWAGGVDSEDHFLDISVHPDRSWHWRDEDEFAEAQRAGLMGPAQALRVREAGLRAVTRIREWGPPFGEDWPNWRPDPTWTIPPLPDNWDRTPAHVS